MKSPTTAPRSYVFPRQLKLSSTTRRTAVGLALAVVVMVMATTAFASISFILKWGTAGSANGQFLTPRGIAVDSSGNVYVADGGNTSAQKFDNNGNFLLKFG